MPNPCAGADAYATTVQRMLCDAALREDVRTHIGATLVYEVKPLSDPEKAETLAQLAAARGSSGKRRTTCCASRSATCPTSWRWSTRSTRLRWSSNAP